MSPASNNKKSLVIWSIIYKRKTKIWRHTYLKFCMVYTWEISSFKLVIKKRREQFVVFIMSFWILHGIIYKRKANSIEAFLVWIKLIIRCLVSFVWFELKSGGRVHTWHFFSSQMSKAMPAQVPLWEARKIHSVCSRTTIVTFNKLTEHVTPFGQIHSSLSTSCWKTRRHFSFLVRKKYYQNPQSFYTALSFCMLYPRTICPQIVKENLVCSWLWAPCPYQPDGCK